MLISIKDVEREFVKGDVVTKAIRGVSFDIKEGEFVAITGSSGSGKSTLMHTIGFLDKPTGGKYFFDEKDTSNFEENELADLRNRELGFVFQTFNLLPKISLIENILLPTIYTEELDRETARERALEIIESLGLSKRTNHRANHLSGGEMQRTAIARALINNPKLILADEPTGNLDSKSGHEVMEIFKDLNKKGNTIVMVTHEDDIAEYTDRTLNLKDGKLESATGK